MLDDGLQKVLLIEDDLTYRNPLSDYFSAHGCSVTTADDGAMGMEKLLFFKPNLTVFGMTFRNQ